MPTEENFGWLAQSLRLTLFTSAVLPGAETLWAGVAGQPPTVDQYQPRELFRTQFGVLGDFGLTAQVNPARTDIIVGVPSPLSTTFAPFNEGLQSFSGLVIPWLGKIDAEILRIAFGAVLLYPAKDRTAAYEIIGRYVPSLKVDPAGSRELLYRINRPKVGADGLELNRITAWAAIVARTAVIAGSSTAQLAAQDFASLELDHSTPALLEHPLNNARLVAIFNELVALGTGNAAQGEIPE